MSLLSLFVDGDSRNQVEILTATEEHYVLRCTPSLDVFVNIEVSFLLHYSTPHVTFAIHGEIQDPTEGEQILLQSPFGRRPHSLCENLHDARDDKPTAGVYTFQKTYFWDNIAINQAFVPPYTALTRSEPDDPVELSSGGWIGLYGLDDVRVECLSSLSVDFVEQRGIAVSLLRFDRPELWERHQVYAIRLGFFMRHPPRGRFLRVSYPYDVHYFILDPKWDEVLASHKLLRPIRNCRLWYKVAGNPRKGFGPLVEALKHAGPGGEVSEEILDDLNTAEADFWLVTPRVRRAFRFLPLPPGQFQLKQHLRGGATAPRSGGQATWLLYQSREFSPLPFATHYWKIGNAEYYSARSSLIPEYIRPGNYLSFRIERYDLDPLWLYDHLLRHVGVASFTYAVSRNWFLTVAAYVASLLIRWLARIYDEVRRPPS